MKRLESDVDANFEIGAVVDFLQSRWDLDGVDVRSLVAQIYDHASQDARAWFDVHPAWLAILEARKERNATLIQQIGAVSGDMAQAYDSTNRMVDAMMFGINKVAEAGRDIDGKWRFERRSGRVQSYCASTYPALSAARPKGWEAHERHQSDSLEQDWEEFAGHDTAGAGSLDFVERVSRSNVLYQDREQGRSPGSTLASAIYAHFLSIVEHNNTMQMTKDLKSIRLDAPFGIMEDPYLIFSVEPVSPLIRVLVDHATASVRKQPFTQEQFEKVVSSKAAFDALSPEEREALVRKNKEKTSAMIKDMLKEERGPSEETIKQRQREQDALNQLLRQHVDQPSLACEEVSRERPCRPT